MIHANLIDKVSHTEPHLCIQLTDAQHERINDIAERANKIYGTNLEYTVFMAFLLLENEVKAMEEALRGKGRKVG